MGLFFHRHTFKKTPAAGVFFGGAAKFPHVSASARQGIRLITFLIFLMLAYWEERLSLT
jgi:hypothetical protein